MPKVSKQSTKPVTRKRTGGVLDRIVGIDEEVSGGIRLNLYGKSGTGKTSLYATFPSPILAVLCSGGNKPGELISINTPENRKRIKKVVLKETSELFDLVDHQQSTGTYKTVVMDHATGLQDYVLKEILGLDDIPTQLSWGVASQQDWGQVGVQMKELLRALLNLDCNVIIVAQEREFNNDGDGSLLLPYVGSALTPSVTGWLNPACDYICQTFIRPKMVKRQVKVGSKTKTVTERGDGVEYCLRTGPSEVYTTKIRAPKGSDLPMEIVDPTYEKLLKVIKR